MVDYAKLAAQAKVMQDAEKVSANKHNGLKVDPRAFFDRVRTHLLDEMTKANVELHKRNAVGFGRNHMPGFEDEVFITYGTDLLCRVRLVIRGGTSRITAVISGPPNGFELSRKEYRLGEEDSSMETFPGEGGQLPTAGSRPEEIAEEIISGVLQGTFI